jgi:hypothetical protein
MQRTVRKTTLVFIAATGVFILLLAQWRTHSQTLSENLTNPLPGLTAAQLNDFNDGLAEFGAAETIAEGLGPVFNGKSCAECRAEHGRFGAQSGRGAGDAHWQNVQRAL